ncbi:hypothetical protein ALQ50_05525 [Pseudomonas coronafaciens pv. coronafaciens]|nr:hypothetical protein ALQ50_05525 [Pseudomonas coronafaciens pv. coronafaciens]
MGMAGSGSGLAKNVKKVRLAHQVQRPFRVHRHTLCLRHTFAQPHRAFCQRAAANRMPTGVEFQNTLRFIGQCQQVAAGLVELQAGQITNGQPAIALAVGNYLEIAGGVVVGLWKAAHLDDLHRVAFSGNEQALAHRVIGQPLVTFVAARVDPQRQLLGVGGVEAFCVVIDVNLNQPQPTLVADDIRAGADVFNSFSIAKAHQRNAPQHAAIEAQLDQLGILVGHCEQALAIRVVTETRNIIFQPCNNLPFCHDAILIKANGLKRFGLPEHLPVEQGALYVAIPLIGEHEYRNQRHKREEQE